MHFWSKISTSMQQYCSRAGKAQQDYYYGLLVTTGYCLLYCRIGNFVIILYDVHCTPLHNNNDEALLLGKSMSTLPVKKVAFVVVLRGEMGNK